MHPRFASAVPTALAGASLALAALLAPAPAKAAPVAAPGYTVSVFAKSPQGSTRPDSIAVVGNRIWVGYGNGGDPTGANGAKSTLVEYSFAGKIVRTMTIVGHNDGMRLDPFTRQIWALQNEDGNSTLVVIDPVSGAREHYRFPPGHHGGGYDDVAFRNGIAYVSASNPTLDAAGRSHGPSLVSVTPLPDHAIAVTPVLGAAPRAIDTATGQSETLNLTDPDSTILTPAGDLLMDSQGDGELVRIAQASGQVYVTHLLGGVQVDDTAYATARHGFLLVSDKPGNVIYRINAATWAPGTAYSAMSGVSGTQSIAGYVGQLDFGSGALVPIVSGLDAGAGMVFVPAP